VGDAGCLPIPLQVFLSWLLTLVLIFLYRSAAAGFAASLDANPPPVSERVRPFTSCLTVVAGAPPQVYTHPGRGGLL
jgi:hypothetical protein